MSKIQVTSAEINSMRISKAYTLEVDGKEIQVTKWHTEDEYTTEADWDYDNPDEVNSLSEETQEQLYDFVNDLDVWEKTEI